MYAQDYDETIVPWRNCPTRAQDDSAGLPTCTTSDVQLPYIWVTSLMPYMKSRQIMFCPSFSPANIGKAMDQADCDGNGSPGSGSAGYIPPNTAKPNTGGGAGYISHYGIAFALKGGTGTQADPYYDFPGSGWLIDPTSGKYTYSARTLASIVEPARSTNISDGVTVYLTSIDRIGTAMGCEARYEHKGNSGGNFSFLDGHSKMIIGNSQRYLDQDAAGNYYMRYHTGNK